MKLLFNRLAILPDAKQEKEGSIILSEEKPPNTATVKYVADDMLYVKEGDRVVFPVGQGTELEYEGQSLILLSEKQITAVI